jgi:hypothetical protein
MRERRGAYRALVEKPRGQKTLGMPRRRREDKIKIYLQGWDEVAWTGLIWVRIGTGGRFFLYLKMKLRVP